MRKAIRILLVVIAAAAVAGGARAWYLRRNGSTRATVRTELVKRGDLVATINATGTVEPEEVIDVGAQVAGRINTFGRDKNGKSIDYGSVVEEGTILAQIDDSLYAADVGLAQAQLEQARAGILRAEADLQQLKAKQDQAQRDWERAQKLGPSEALAPTAYDAYKAGCEIATANVGVGRAAVEQARSAAAQAQAGLDRAQRNLSYCTIKSPVQGVIIDRRVNIGQTVVASLNAPSLFLLAKDLKRIQVWVPVNEVDIGSIFPGQAAVFTVETFPDQVFHGQVGKVRLNATMTQNVITYTVEVNTDNADGKLLPYLTANVYFETGRRQDVLLAPKAALRWWPRPELIAPEFRETTDAAATSSNAAGATPPAAPEGSTQSQGTLWVEQGTFVRPVSVSVGLTDMSVAEVQGAGLAEGMRVVVGEQQPESSAGPGAAASPFTPQMRRAR